MCNRNNTYRETYDLIRAVYLWRGRDEKNFLYYTQKLHECMETEKKKSWRACTLESVTSCNIRVTNVSVGMIAYVYCSVHRHIAT